MPCYWLHIYPPLVDLEYCFFFLKKSVLDVILEINRFFVFLIHNQGHTHTHTMQDGPLLVFPAHTDSGMIA